MGLLLRTRPWVFLVGIIVLALLIRLPAVTYGLPYHVFGDEEVNVYGALKMLELRTLLPVFHPDAFTILYEPPLLAFVYTALFVPVIGVLWLVHGMPSFTILADALTLDPSVLWLAARTFTVLLSLGSLYLLYRIARSLFKNEQVALWSALFFALSFFETTLASTARHWTATTFFSLLAFFLTLKAFESKKWFYLVASGTALGLAFGVGYLVFYAPVIALLVLWHVMKLNKTTVGKVRNFVLLGFAIAVPFTLTAAFFVAVHPYPFFVQVINHVVDPATRSIGSFLVYFSRTLWLFETPLVLGSIVGLIALMFTRNKWAVLFFSFFIVVAVPMYLFMQNIERYVMPLIPMLALLSGFGVHVIASSVPPRMRKFALSGIIFIVFGYAGLLYGRYELLVMHGDTRVEAKEWLESHISSDRTVLILSDRLRLFPSEGALEVQARLAPATLRSSDRTLLGGQISPSIRLNVFSLYATSEDEQHELIQTALAEDPHAYVVIDSWAPKIKTLPENRGVIQKFEGPGAVPGVDALFIGGDEHHTYRHVLTLLYGIKQFGPDVTVGEVFY